MEEDIPHGVVKDPRESYEKVLDYQHPYGAPIVSWIEKPQSAWKRYKQRNQINSFSCIGQATAKAKEVLTGVVHSAHPIYRRRKNYAGEGMWLQDAGDIHKNLYTTTEVLDPSENKNEVDLNKDITAQTYLGVEAYVFCSPKNIDQIANAIDTYGQCALTFESNGGEWKLVPQYLGTPITFGHCICAVDRTLYNGKKALICEDSAGQGSSPDGLRIITEDFLVKRCTGAMYFTKAIDHTPIAPQPTPEPSPAQKLSWIEYFYRLFGGKGNPYK